MAQFLTGFFPARGEEVEPRGREKASPQDAGEVQEDSVQERDEKGAQAYGSHFHQRGLGERPLHVLDEFLHFRVLIIRGHHILGSLSNRSEEALAFALKTLLVCIYSLSMVMRPFPDLGGDGLPLPELLVHHPIDERADLFFDGLGGIRDDVTFKFAFQAFRVHEVENAA